MEDFVYFNSLYDCYSSLLTEKQRVYFEEYYFNNLSLSEIAEIYDVSRNACYKQIQITIDKLKDYEEKLNLNKKKKIVENLVDKTKDLDTKKILESLLQ